MIFPRCADLFETVKYFRHARCPQAVKDLLPPLLIDDQADVPKHSEVVGYGGGVAADHPRQLPHALLAFRQHVHDQQPA